MPCRGDPPVALANRPHTHPNHLPQGEGENEGFHGRFIKSPTLSWAELELGPPRIWCVPNDRGTSRAAPKYEWERAPPPDRPPSQPSPARLISNDYLAWSEICGRSPISTFLSKGLPPRQPFSLRLVPGGWLAMRLSSSVGSASMSSSTPVIISPAIRPA